MKKSALTENDGIASPEIVSVVSVAKIRQLRKNILDANELINGILNRNITALSRAITLIESTNNNHFSVAHDIVDACLPHANKSIRIGITGVPGVGKSTFIEVFGKYLTNIGKRVAVLAVDPSSNISNGSILGDKTRMEELVKDNNAFVRPSASGGTLGGVARKTRETITLCEASGFDIILIETVGVGQSETAVHSMVDFFLLLNLAGAGDGLQGIKRGIMEMADLVIVNKADGDNVTKARLASTEIGRALHFFAMKKSGWLPKVTTCSAVENIGIANVWSIITEYIDLTKANDYFEHHRAEQNQFWMLETINESLKNHFYNNQEFSNMLKEKEIDVKNGLLSPFLAAKLLTDAYFTKKTNI